MGDTNMCTDNPVIVKNTKNSRTIVCVQRKAEKKIPEEQDFIVSNKRAFKNKIGEVTNKITAMIEVQAGFEPDSAEYKELAYRIMCGQHYQQCAIDAMKGIIAKPMPEYWYSIRDNIAEDSDSPEVAAKKDFNLRISAAVKPYFMMYVYPQLKRDYREFIDNANKNVAILFGDYGVYNVKELEGYKHKTAKMREFLEFYYRFMPVGINPCTINRICWLFEKTFKHKTDYRKWDKHFDYTILKSGVEYSQKSYDKVSEIYNEYKARLDKYLKRVTLERIDDFSNRRQQQIFKEYFKQRCAIACTNEQELCDIVLDLCYQNNKTKAFCWDICGEIIVDNLLKKANNLILFPKASTEDDSDFEYCGQYFKMTEKKVNDYDYNE